MRSFITNSTARSQPLLPLPRPQLEETIKTDSSIRSARIKTVGEEDVAVEGVVAKAEEVEAAEAIEDGDEAEEDMDEDTLHTITTVPTHKAGNLIRAHIPMTNGII